MYIRDDLANKLPSSLCDLLPRFLFRLKKIHNLPLANRKHHNHEKIFTILGNSHDVGFFLPFICTNPMFWRSRCMRLSATEQQFHNAIHQSKCSGWKWNIGKYIFRNEMRFEFPGCFQQAWPTFFPSRCSATRRVCGERTFALRFD